MSTQRLTTEPPRTRATNGPASEQHHHHHQRGHEEDLEREREQIGEAGEPALGVELRAVAHQHLGQSQLGERAEQRAHREHRRPHPDRVLIQEVGEDLDLQERENRGGEERGAQGERVGADAAMHSRRPRRSARSGGIGEGPGRLRGDGKPTHERDARAPTNEPGAAGDPSPGAVLAGAPFHQPSSRPPPGVSTNFTVATANVSGSASPHRSRMRSRVPARTVTARMRGSPAG